MCNSSFPLPLSSACSVQLSALLKACGPASARALLGDPDATALLRVARVGVRHPVSAANGTVFQRARPATPREVPHPRPGSHVGSPPSALAGTRRHDHLQRALSQALVVVSVAVRAADLAEDARTRTYSHGSRCRRGPRHQIGEGAGRHRGVCTPLVCCQGGARKPRKTLVGVHLALCVAHRRVEGRALG